MPGKLLRQVKYLRLWPFSTRVEHLGALSRWEILASFCYRLLFQACPLLVAKARIVSIEQLGYGFDTFLSNHFYPDTSFFQLTQFWGATETHKKLSVKSTILNALMIQLKIFCLLFTIVWNSVHYCKLLFKHIIYCTNFVEFCLPPKKFLWIIIKDLLRWDLKQVSKSQPWINFILYH